MRQDMIIIILSIALLLFLLWKEIRRAKRARLLPRILATIIAVSMLVLLFIPVTFYRSSSNTAGQDIILITAAAGVPADSIAHHKVLTTDPSKAGKNVLFIPDLSVYLSQHAKEIASVRITGTGIEEHEWKKLELLNIAANYTATETPAGIIKADWQRTMISGDRLQVYGMFNNRKGKEQKLVLTGLGTRFDSVLIKADSIQSFTLSCRPAHTGATVYELESWQNDQLVGSEKLPVIIQPSVKARILVLASSPDFENRFLSSWLYENNYALAVRNTVSRGKYDLQFLNMKAIPLNSISSSALDNFDLVIADDNALAELDAGSSSAVRSCMEKGMGLIIQTDSSASLSSFSRAFSFSKQGLQKNTAQRSLLFAGSTEPQTLAAEQWFAIQPDPQAQALVTDDRQSVIASCRLYGSGRMILNTAGTTYSWLLSGNKENYSSFWSLLINKSAKTRKQETAWRYTPPYPTMDQQVQIVMEKESQQPPVIKTAAGELYTTQTPYLPDTWTASWWPANTGWQTLSCTDTASIYVFEKNDWSAAKRYAQINDNIMQAARHKSTLKQTVSSGIQTNTVPVYLFFIGLVGACSFLWWEARRSDGG